MGASYNAGVYLGFKLEDIGFKVELREEEFEVHDKRGKKTGKVDIAYSWRMEYHDEVSDKEGETFYTEYIEDVLELSKIEGINIQVYRNDYDYDSFNPENVIIGIEVVSKKWDEYVCMKEIEIDEKVKEKLTSLFGVVPKPYLYFYVS